MRRRGTFLDTPGAEGKLRSLYESGLTASQIGDAIGVSAATVRIYLRRIGIGANPLFNGWKFVRRAQSGLTGESANV